MNVRRFVSRLSMTLLGWVCLSSIVSADSLTPMVYTGTNSGAWELAANWTPNGVPTNTHAVYITNLTVKVATEALVGRLEVIGGSLIVAGAETTVLTQTPSDPVRTSPVGLAVTGDFWLAGDCSIGGVDQLCTSYLTVGGDLTLSGGKALAVYAGPTNGTTVTFQTGGAHVTVTGTTTVNTGSWIYPDCDPFTGAPVIFNLQNLTIADGAGFDATQRGWGYRNLGPTVPPAGILYEKVTPDYYGTLSPGAGTGLSVGGGYGGNGGGVTATRGKVYGYPYAPLQPGAPNGAHTLPRYRRGGGAIRIAASNITFNGALYADAGEQSGFGGSSGGGIWVTCDHIDIEANARVSAVGGDITAYSAGGGGGRVSIGVGLSAEAITSLYAGQEPDDLLYEPLRQVPVNVRGGLQYAYKYAPSGTATLVQTPAADRFLQVQGSPLQAGIPTAGYGTHRYTLNQFVTNQVSLSGLDPLSTRVRYTCAGYTLANTNGVFASGTTNWVAMELSKNLTLTWLWTEPEVRVDASARANGVVRRGIVEGAFSEWLAQDVTSTAVEAVPDAGYEFLYWLGDVPVGMATNNPLQFMTDVPRTMQALFRLAEAPTTRVWKGGTAAVKAWHDVANWLPAGNIPGKDDHVVINAGYCYTTNYTECGSLTISNTAILRVASQATTANRAKRTESTTQLALGPVFFDEGRLVVRGDLDLQQSAQLGIGGDNQTYATTLEVGGDMRLRDTASLAVYGGPTNQLFDFVTGTASVRVGGLLQVGPGCWVYPTSDRYTGGSPRFEVNRLTVDAGGGFDATVRGFDHITGLVPETGALAPGQGYSLSIGAGYGGEGGSASSLFGQIYGFTNAPIFPGSCNGMFTTGHIKRGGGLVRLHASGTATLSGSIISDGSQGGGQAGGPSGGGIWITSPRLQIEPGSLLQARGGTSAYATSGGGGGRIALGIKLTGDDLAQLCTTGEAISKVKEIDATAFSIRYPGASSDVSAVKAGQPGTFMLLDATQARTTILIR